MNESMRIKGWINELIYDEMNMGIELQNTDK